MTRYESGVELGRPVPEMARWGLLNCSLVVLRRAGRAAPAEAEPRIEATLGAMNRAEDMIEVVRCQLKSEDVLDDVVRWCCWWMRWIRWKVVKIFQEIELELGGS